MGKDKKAKKVIILDFSGGNTHKNEWSYLKEMIDSVVLLQKYKKNFIFTIKHQLFVEAGDNIPLKHKMFVKAYNYALDKGIWTTASVFDLSSLHYLLNFKIPFVKIANNRKLDYLLEHIPKDITTIISYGNVNELDSLIDKSIELKHANISYFMCVSKYPATIEDYEKTFSCTPECHGISDHTPGLDFYNKYPYVNTWEMHYVLKHDKDNLDGGPFAKTYKELLFL